MFKTEEVGRRIQNLRKARGLTQEGLAEKLNVSCHTVRKIEQGKRSMSTDLLLDIAQALDTTTDYILQGRIAANEQIKFLLTFKKELVEFIDERLIVS